MSLRLEFVTLATAEGANIRELCKRFQLSPRTAYKWINRFQSGGREALCDRSRRPRRQPRLTPANTTELILQLRQKHPAWGGLKIKKRLEKLGHSMPSPSTITEILRRNGCIDPETSAQHQPFKRFEHPAPNDLWQIDFKGHFALAKDRCHPLTAIDDHSRYAVILAPCLNEQGETVKEHLARAFKLCGMPWAILTDNGSPWGSGGGPDRYTTLGVWILRLGIHLIHGRPGHPQTQGKEERFNRTLKDELLSRSDWRSLEQCQREFQNWRQIYNHERPHQAISLQTPAELYRPSPRSFPAQLPEINYSPEDIVKKVKSKGEITYANQFYYIGRAFVGLPIALRQTNTDGLLEVYFIHQKLGEINLKEKLGDKYCYQSIKG